MVQSFQNYTSDNFTKIRKMCKGKIEKFWNYGEGHTALAAVCAHSASASIGICQGYSSILLPQLKDDESEIFITTSEGSWLASLGAISNPIGSVLSGVFAEYLGRRRSIQMSSIPFLIGWFVIGFSTDLNWLYVGRFVSGIGAGMSTACYTYVGEISTAQNRGVLQAIGPICASLGILFVYSLGYYVRWPTVALLSNVFAIFTLVAVQFLPESPAYLIKTGRTAECFNSYVWFRRNPAVANEEVLRHSCREDDGSCSKVTFKQYFTFEAVLPFLLLVTLFFLQQLSGIYIIMFYAVDFFQNTNLGINDYVASILVGGLRLTMALACAVLLNKFGRRTLCMVSSLGMAVSMLVMAVYFKYYESNDGPRIAPLLPLICIIVNVCFSMIGMLPIPWILVGELFPLSVRSLLSGLVICIGQIFIFAAVKLYPNMLHVLNFSGTLGTFCLASILALVFCKVFLIETKNRTLEEISDGFRKTEN